MQPETGEQLKFLKGRIMMHKEQGFTLIEVIVVTVIMAILAGMAVTSLSSAQSELRAAACNLRTELLSAKAEAIKRNETVQIHFGNGTNRYNATTKDTNILLFSHALSPGLSLSTGKSTVGFTPLGTATSSKVSISGSDKTYNCTINGMGHVTVEP